MHAQNDYETTGHNRTIRFSDIPDHEIKVMDVACNYTGHGNAGKGVVIDGIIMPRIMKGLRLAEIFEDMDVSEVEDMMEQMKKFTPPE